MLQLLSALRVLVGAPSSPVRRVDPADDRGSTALEILGIAVVLFGVILLITAGGVGHSIIAGVHTAFNRMSGGG